MDVTLRIHTQDGKTHRAQAPLDMSTDEFLREVVSALLDSENNRPDGWILYNKVTSAVLQRGRTLAENGVQAGQDLYLNYRRSEAGAANVCQYCGGENASTSRFCTVCGKPLTRSQVRRIPEADLQLHVHIADGSTRSAETPSNLPVGEFVADLVRSIGAMTRDGKGREIQWKLDDKDSGRSLDSTRSFAENGVRSGQHLYLRSEEAPALKITRGKTEIRGLWKIAAALLVIVLLGVAAIFKFYPSKPGPPSPQRIILILDPDKATLSESQRLQFRAKVTGATDEHVDWTVEPRPGEVPLGAISRDGGLYIAPFTFRGSPSVTIKATSKADPKVFAIATVTLETAVKTTVKPASPPKAAARISLSIGPKEPSMIWPGHAQQFSATVHGSPNTAVQWTISPADAGTIGPDGLYRAPVSVATQQNFTVTATSKADPSKRSTLNMILLSNVLVQVDPASTNLALGKKQKFKANVTGTNNKSVVWKIFPADLGQISEKGEYKAPSSVAPGQTVKITAISNADPHKSATALITLVQKH